MTGIVYKNPGLSAIWGSSPSDIYAVGTRGVIIHYDGSSWNEMDSGTENDLLAVWGSSANDIYIAGADGTILHYDGN